MVIKRKRKENNKQKEEVIVEQIQAEKGESEDYCFVCKDGGLLMVCDHKECVKAYHPACLEKEETTEETEEPWICGWHFCLVCKKNSKYQCFGCKNAVCQSCYKDASFAKVRGTKGFCNDCLKLALLGEEGLDVDSDGEKVDFKDRETYEGLFKEYWDIIKEKEGLTLDDLHNADIEMKKGDESNGRSRKLHQSQKDPSDSDVSVKELEESKESSSDDHESDGDVQPVIVSNIRKKPNNIRKKPNKLPRRRRASKKIEFVGWASKPLIQFLGSIGVETNEKLSQDDVTSLINKYVYENRLFHPDKKKLIVCDERLLNLMGRKSISFYKIRDSLDAHFQDNLNKSDGEGYSSGCEEESKAKASMPTKKQAWWRNIGSFQNKGSLLEKFKQKEVIIEEPNNTDVVEVPQNMKLIYSEFATIVPQNMKLIYLKKCLVEKLLEEHDTFESKVVGSFVKIKSEPFNVKQPYQLLPVTGIQFPGDEHNGKVLLQVSTLSDVPIRLLSNDELSEEDCVDMRQKVDNGLLPKITVVELEKKAKDLHEDITKHWISRELSSLRNRIDLANEKGRRAELFEYHRRRDLLQSETEQSRLLTEIPKVIADVIEVKSPEETEHHDSSKNISNKPVKNGKKSGGNGKISA